MKKIFTVVLIVVGVSLAFYFVGPYKVKTICFGDVCPQNGGTFLLYRHAYSEKECTDKGGKPITGIGWVRVYAGCSPDNTLSVLIENVNK